MHGYPAFPRTDDHIARIMGFSDSTNFNSIKMGRRNCSFEFLRRLHTALRLSEIGLAFDAALWTEQSPSVICERIISLRAKNPVEILIPHLLEQPGFHFHSENRTLIGRWVQSDAEPVQIPQMAVQVGEELTLTVQAPWDGFLKMLCLENGLVFGLDNLFGLSHHRLRGGERQTLRQRLRVSRDPPEALFIGVFGKSMFGSEWPVRDTSGSEMVAATCADLMKVFFEKNPDSRATAWRLFLTQSH